MTATKAAVSPHDGKYPFFAHARSLEYRQAGVLKHKPLAAFTEADLHPGIAALTLELGHNPLTKNRCSTRLPRSMPAGGGSDREA